MDATSQKERKPFLFFKQDVKIADPKIDSNKQQLKKVSEKTVITGGAGYFGFTLGRALAKAGTNVILYDVNKPLWEIPIGVLHVQADVRNYADLCAVCEGADCVVHAAAYGMTGIEQLHKKHIQSVNVGGTRVVIEVCRQCNVPRLIYTSSINVVFAGQAIVDGDEENVPYVPLRKQINEYAKTKTIAEQMVLAANGSPLAGGGKLYTCALRPPGIYGPEEQRHLPRMAANDDVADFDVRLSVFPQLDIERGLFNFRLGAPTTMMNWVHVKNLVQAHILAADALTLEKNYVAGGQAYFINDEEKVNLYEWLTPLFERLGARKPWIRSPASLARLSAVIMEKVHFVLRPFGEITPLLTLNEVNNISCTHTFKTAKARKHLGYAPKKYTLAACVDHFMKKRPRRRNFFLLKCFLFMAFFVALIVLAVKFQEVSDFLRETWGKYPYLVG